ncbi:TetR/AcrR family transcriptional regulator [Pectinatus haikarae]|uniref:AcrR family transcriptional regulator n=1 Tax=Pectinatus haikarae TaxID=349096 RepID=A0ABT9Y787_9FIRM|nr:TetR/AcrR family transcriptional regulator [Pectinatus haikarae]MDQ0203692.1 AcrR family transcriptional regulator [Pectinatus haikarae]
MKKRGRPRDKDTEQAILKASYDLLLEMGFVNITVEKIAEKAKVSKATIYKWWPNKAAVIIDGFLSTATAKLPIPNTGSVIEDITRQSINLSNFLLSDEGKILNELIAQGQFDRRMAEEYRARYFIPRRMKAAQILQNGINRGELSADTDLELCIDMIFGPIFYRLLITGDILNEDYIRKLVHCSFYGIKKC